MSVMLRVSLLAMVALIAPEIVFAQTPRPRTQRVDSADGEHSWTHHDG
jgi:hypothetical protein